MHAAEATKIRKTKIIIVAWTRKILEKRRFSLRKKQRSQQQKN
jgi:hypothetical protein